MSNGAPATKINAPATCPAPYSCPADGCEIFPFETAADLDEHLATGHHPHGPYLVRRVEARFDTARILPRTGDTPAARPAPVAPAKPAPVCRWTKIAGVWLVKGPATVIVAGATVTVTKANGETAEVTLADTVTPGTAGTATAAPAPRTPAKPAPVASLPPRWPLGLHQVGEDIYKVQRGQSGNLYAQALVGGVWDYQGQRPLARLSDATLMTLEQAKEYGRRTGVCCQCGRELSKPESIEAGIGPVCAGRF